MLAAGSCSADVLPDKPQPRPAAAERVADVPYWMEVGIMAAAWTADANSTHQALSQNSGNVEMGPLLHGSRSTVKIMGAWAAVDLGAAVAGYEWKKHVHNRVLHPLWHVFMVERIVGHANSAASNWGAR